MPLLTVLCASTLRTPSGVSLVLLTLPGAAVPFGPGAQAAAQVFLERPDAVFSQDFGFIQTVRERRDGRVLVADPLGEALYLVDLRSGTRTVMGSRGEGPQEYR